MAATPSCPPITNRHPPVATRQAPLRGLLKGATSALQLSVSGLYLPPWWTAQILSQVRQRIPSFPPRGNWSNIFQCLQQRAFFSGSKTATVILNLLLQIQNDVLSAGRSQVENIKWGGGYWNNRLLSNLNIGLFLDQLCVKDSPTWEGMWGWGH